MTRSPRPGPGGKLALFEVLGGNGSSEPAAAPAAPASSPRRVRSSDGSTAPWFRVSTDGGRVHVSTAPVTAIAATGVVAVGLVAAFVVGRATASREASAPVDQQAAIMPEVLDLDTPGADISAAPPVASLADPVASEQLVSEPTAQPIPITQTGRLKGRNYLLIQSYHPSERDGAEATVEALRLAGIGATTETGVRGWSNRICVVGTEPFTRQTRNPELDEYKRRVDAVGRAVAGKRGIKRFDPQLVRWGR
ncbi:MAG: hypothetical protein AAGI46_14445 [Planctomycetota bacterium]